MRNILDKKMKQKKLIKAHTHSLNVNFNTTNCNKHILKSKYYIIKGHTRAFSIPHQDNIIYILNIKFERFYFFFSLRTANIKSHH